MIKKALHKKQDFFTLSFSTIGAIIGFTLLLITVQLHFDVDTIFSDQSDALDADYLVIKKQISDLNTLGVSKGTNFTPEEIEEFKNQPFVKDLAHFKSGNFEVMATLSVEGGNFPPLTTLAFFESIPDRFIDIETNEWDWQEEEKDVAIIVPSFLLDIYNYGIAQSSNSPQMSKNIASSFKFRLAVEGNGYRETYLGNVIDFSDRINSILVPESFLEFSNKKYGAVQNNDPSRIIIATNNAHDPRLIQYLEDNAYETNKEQLRGGKVEELLRGFLSFHLGIGIVIILLAAMLFVLYSRVLISKSKFEIKLLLILGYNTKQITQQIQSIFMRMFILVGLVSFSCFVFIKFWFNGWLKNQLPVELSSTLSVTTFIIGLVFLFAFLILTVFSIRKEVRQIAAPNS